MEKANDERSSAGILVESGAETATATPETNLQKADEKREENFFRSFKSKDELTKAYTSLEREFTKKSQQLKELQKGGAVRNIDAEADTFLKKFPEAAARADEIKAVFAEEPNLIGEEGALERAYVKVLSKKAPEELREDFLSRALQDTELKERVVLDYLKQLPANLPSLILGGTSPLTAPKRVKTLSEAGAEALQILKR